MRVLTDAAYLIAAICTSPLWIVWLMRTGQQRTDWRARFGFGVALPAPNERGRILIHAVSMGEVNAARLLVEQLSMHHEVVLSATTDTGFARAVAIAPEGVRVVRYPLDISMAVERFLLRVKPDLVALVELEAWPNFIRACSARSIPIAVVNGRISDRGFRRYRLVRFFLTPLFKRFRFVSAQTQLYAQRFMDMGVAQERVSVGGTMKWDGAMVASDVQNISSTHAQHTSQTSANKTAHDALKSAAHELAREMGIDVSRPLVVAGSTAEGEEKLIRSCVPTGVQLLCAPRKPARFNQAAADLPGCIRRTERSIGSGAGEQGSDLFLLDTMGELKKAYALATVVVVGRSFGALHGSDMMEPVALGKATIIGPRYGDFADTAERLLEAGGLLCVSAEALSRTVLHLITDASARENMIEAAYGVIAKERGATTRNEMLLRALWQESHEAKKNTLQARHIKQSEQSKQSARGEQLKQSERGTDVD